MTVMDERTRCIVLRPTTGADSQTLNAAMASRDWSWEERSDPFVVMAELCLCQRAESARAAWGLAPRETIALTVAGDHEHQPLVDAVRTYLPAVQIWRIDDDGLWLQHHGEPTMLAAKTPPPRSPVGHPPLDSPTVSRSTPLKLAEASLEVPFPAPPLTDAEVRDAENDDDDAPAPDGPNVTQDELAMLLAFDPPPNEETS